MALFQTRTVQVQAILWPGWTDDPWSDEWKAFFDGQNWINHIKATYDANGVATTLLYTGGAWKPVPNGSRIVKAASGAYTFMSTGDFDRKYEPVP